MGDKEIAAGNIAVHASGNVDLSVVQSDDFIAKIVTYITAKAYVLAKI